MVANFRHSIEWKNGQDENRPQAPLANSPCSSIRPRRVLRSKSIPLQNPPGSLTMFQKPNRKWDTEDSTPRPEYHSISCELHALAKMVRDEFGNGEPTTGGIAIAFLVLSLSFLHFSLGFRQKLNNGCCTESERSGDHLANPKALQQNLITSKASKSKEDETSTPKPSKAKQETPKITSSNSWMGVPTAFSLFVPGASLTCATFSNGMSSTSAEESESFSESALLDEEKLEDGVQSGDSLSSTPTGGETPNVIDLRKQQRKEPERPLYQETGEFEKYAEMQSHG
ncbi:hypothetical protein DKX38_017821 [Salix brachista]|uniref:Uncharacterized protein n=1 Tax=Salix brachista TaxID=2182728 RepID=A0A5N5KW83_9ROSI|nr:hypothetical protein DKX38_017815 [Salix brachista]KAB5534735.1 hypothetical protein DKX38_017821 [Salix brachista]